MQLQCWRSYVLHHHWGVVLTEEQFLHFFMILFIPFVEFGESFSFSFGFVLYSPRDPIPMGISIVLFLYPPRHPFLVFQNCFIFIFRLQIQIFFQVLCPHLLGSIFSDSIPLEVSSSSFCPQKVVVFCRFLVGFTFSFTVTVKPTRNRHKCRDQKSAADRTC